MVSTCINCNEESNAQFLCNQCNSSFCENCQPAWKVVDEICSGCLARNGVVLRADAAFTQKLKQIFYIPAPAPEEPNLAYPLPWHLMEERGSFWLYSGERRIAMIDDLNTALWVRDAANSRHELMKVAAHVYERIRGGDVFFTGSEQDVQLWQRVRELIK